MRANQNQSWNSIEAVEAQYTQLIDKFYEQVLDLNVPQSAAVQMVNKALALRAKLLGLYGVPPDPKWSPNAVREPLQQQQQWSPPMMPMMGPMGAMGAMGGMGGMGGKGAMNAMGKMGAMAAAGRSGKAAAAKPRGKLVPPEEIKWVSKLNEILTKKLKNSLQKGDISFESVSADDEAEIYYASLKCVHLKETYVGERPAKTRKDAEHAAAQVAMKAEFPEAYRAALFAPPPPPQPAPGSVKRKAENPAPPPEGKSQLTHFMQMILQRSVTKEDMIYDTTEPVMPGDIYHCTVRLPTYDESMAFDGEGPTRKDAEMAAARAACATLEPVAIPMIEEHKAKKHAKVRENMEKFFKAKQEKAEKEQLLQLQQEQEAGAA